MTGRSEDSNLPTAAAPEGAVRIFGDEPLTPEEMLNLFEYSRGDVTAICSSEGVFGYASPACRSTLGWDPVALIGRSLLDFVHPEDLTVVHAARRSVLSSPTATAVAHRFRRPGGGFLWTESILQQTSNPRRPGEHLLMVSIRDVADRKLMEARLQRQALTDPLTGIANRTVLMERLGQALAHLEESPSVLAVVYLDLDRFKVINDSLGHDVGDRLLMKVTERAMDLIRPTDTLARIGGDEFVLLAEGLGSVKEARALATRFCKSLEHPFDLDGEPIVCTTSAGLATTTDPDHGAAELLQEADLALYRAKSRGRNRAEVFDEELRTAAVDRLAVEQMVRNALAEDHLVVHYQPIVSLTTGHVTRVEALLRIDDHDQLVFPDHFIDVAEETGLLVAIDEHVLAVATQQIRRWQDQLGIDDFSGVTINVTGRHLSDPRFIVVLADALHQHELPHRSLGIEVTERVLMEASPSAMESLAAIRDLGVLVGLDDFGTGYSSLAYLRQFPLDFVKIDQSFVRQIARTGHQDVAILTAIIDLAHALGLWVVAEGVETADQLDTLVGLRCDYAQGYLFGRAAAPAATAALITERATRQGP